MGGSLLALTALVHQVLHAGEAGMSHYDHHEVASGDPCPQLDFTEQEVCQYAVATNLSCAHFKSQEDFRQEMLDAARESREMWASTSFSLSLAALIVDSVILLLLPVLRRQRSVQAAGWGHMNIILAGCFAGHFVTLLDGYSSLAESGVWCRGRLVMIYVFLRYARRPRRSHSLGPLSRAHHRHSSTRCTPFASRRHLGSRAAATSCHFAPAAPFRPPRASRSPVLATADTSLRAQLP